MQKRYKCLHCGRIAKWLAYWMEGQIYDACYRCQDKGVIPKLRVEKPPKIKRKRIPQTVERKKIRIAWKGMLRRCYASKWKGYHRYGGRGIRVCEDWHNFEIFYNWAVNHGYKIGLHIDRINNNDSYYPENCRFITHKENCNNTSVNKYIKYNNQIKTISQWADYFNVNYQVFYIKLKHNGYQLTDDLIKTLEQTITSTVSQDDITSFSIPN